MSWVMAGVASATATMAGVQYVKGKRDAKKAEKARPQYEIPDEIKQNLSQAQVMALEGMPQQEYDDELRRIKQQTADAKYQISSRKGGLAGVSGMYEREGQSGFNLAKFDAGIRRQNQLGLMQQRGITADYGGMEFQLDKLNPYYEKRAQDQARTGALFQNLMSAGGVAAMGMGGGKRTAPVSGTRAASSYIQPAYNTMPNGQQSSTYNPYYGQQTLNQQGVQDPYGNQNPWQYNNQNQYDWMGTN